MGGSRRAGKTTGDGLRKVHANIRSLTTAAWSVRALSMRVGRCQMLDLRYERPGNGGWIRDAAELASARKCLEPCSSRLRQQGMWRSAQMALTQAEQVFPGKGLAGARACSSELTVTKARGSGGQAVWDRVPRSGNKVSEPAEPGLRPPQRAKPALQHTQPARLQSTAPLHCQKRQNCGRGTSTTPREPRPTGRHIGWPRSVLATRSCGNASAPPRPRIR